MPRKADEFEVLEKPKRAPRKRVAKTVDAPEEEKVKPKRKPRAKKVTEEKEETVSRKAPTAIKEERDQQKSSKKHLIIISVLLLIGVASSAVIGLSDKGQIDVVTMIDERNRKAEERGEKIISNSIKDQLPDGGLVPADPASIASSTVPVAATSTASTTPIGNIPRTDAEVMGDAVATATST